MSMSRREFIRLAALAVLGHQTAAAAEPGQATGVSLLAHIREQQAARRLGEVYLARYPGEADRAVLLAGLPAEPDEVGTLRRLDDRIRDDFDRGDICCLEGWYLSRTEGRLYALLVLREATA